MKRWIGIFLVMALLCGCSADDGELERALILRSKVQQSGIEFDADIVADYGDKSYSFSMKCQSDTAGNLKFEVTKPESIAGITGTVGKGTGNLTFDDKMLAFDVLADGLISPVSGPWVMIETLRSGYLTACGREGDGLRLTIDDSYAEKALHLDFWLDSGDLPKYCEVYWNGRKLLSITVSSFAFV